uniref:Protein FAM98A n=1 Tax=Trichogramma kaykai TaxID=54128 RepID=A0ABD2W562_9HYME
MNTMENEILNILEDVGYTGSLLNLENLTRAIQEGAQSTEYTGLVSWLTDQIGSFGVTEETVHVTSSSEDASSFLLEINTFLKEIGCLNTRLTTGITSQLLSTYNDREALIEYLATELMTCKVLDSYKPKDQKFEVIISESVTAKYIREMMVALKFQKPPENITFNLIFKKIMEKIKEILKKVPKELIGNPLFLGELNTDQWNKLNQIYHQLYKEYSIRREMLLKRLDMTISSFTWSERTKPLQEQIYMCFHPKRDAMRIEPYVTCGDLLSTREDLAVIEKTSSASVRKNTKSSVNKVIIGAVPDRGGRSWEQEPPPPEMPPWQKDKVPAPSRGGGRGSRGSQHSVRGSPQGGQHGSYGGFQTGYGGQQHNKGNDQREAQESHHRAYYDSQGSYSSNRNTNQSSFNRHAGFQSGYPENRNQRSNHRNFNNHQGIYQNNQSGQGDHQNYHGHQGNYQSQNNLGNRHSNYGQRGSGRVQGGWNNPRANDQGYQQGNRKY